MAKTDKDLLQEAVADADKVKEAAIENAKEMIVKAFTPKIKGIISAGLEDDDPLTEDENQPAGYDEEGGQERIEGSDDPSEKGDGPAIIEQDEDLEEELVDEDDMDVEDEEEVEIEPEPELEPEDEEEIDVDMGEDDEEIDIDIEDDEEEEDFGDMGEDDVDVEDDEDTIEIVDDEDEDEVDVEMECDDDEMYEALESTLKENRTLKREIKRYRKTLGELKEQFEAVNLFNAKLVYANKALHRGGLTKDQKVKILETFDTAGSIREVKIIYKTLSENAGEGKKKVKVKKEVVKSVKRIDESAEAPGSSDAVSNRLQELAGI